MRRVLFSSLWSALFVSSAYAGAIIQYDISNSSTNAGGQTVYQLTYTVSNVSFSANQELAFQFDPAIYSSLSNGSVPSGFNWIILQPNQPLGASGVFSAVAVVPIQSLTGKFSVTAVMNGSAQPGAQQFSINQLNGDVIGATLDSGSTIAGGTSAVPEPVMLPVTLLALLAGGVLKVSRDRAKGTASL